MTTNTQVEATNAAHRCGKCDACYIGGTRTQCPHHVCHECWETVPEYFESDGEGEWTKETSTCAKCKLAGLDRHDLALFALWLKNRRTPEFGVGEFLDLLIDSDQYADRYRQFLAERTKSEAKRASR